MIKKALLFILTLVTLSNTAAQDAILKGLITDAQTQEVLIGALIVVEGTELAAESDLEGGYSLNLPAGTYNIVYSYDTYHADTLKAVTVSEGKILIKNVALRANVTEMEGIVFEQKIDKSSADEVLKNRKEAAVTSDGVDQKTLTKSNNPTVSEGLKKVTGASIQDGKFAVIRGMGDRYNAGYINGSPLPSTESDRKAFSFDILPTSLIDNLIILKSGSPELTGDFGGGVIKIATKSIPDSFMVNIGAGIQMNSVTTGKSYTAFKGSESDWLGYDDNLRVRPKNLTTTLGSNKPGTLLNSYVEDTKKFNNDYSLQKFQAPYGTRLNLAIGSPILKRKQLEWGVVGAYNYNQTYTLSEKIVRVYRVDGDNGQLNADYNDTLGVMSVNNSAIINTGLKLFKNHKLQYKGLNGISTSISNLSRSGDAGITENSIFVNQYTTIMLYNRLRTHQFMGDHSFLSDRLKVDWNISNTKIKKLVPDYRVVTYSTFANEDGDVFTTLPTSQNFSSGNGRFFGDLDEKLNSANINVSYALNNKDSAQIPTIVKFGAFTQKRSRMFESYKYVFDNVQRGVLHPSSPHLDFNNELFDVNNTFMYDPTPLPDRRYNAESKLNAGYVAFEQNFYKKLRLVYGARYEHFNQDVVSGGVLSNLKVATFLPSINLNYKLSPAKSNIRFSAYRTVNRPEFREVAKFAFFDFIQNADFVGNDQLKQADIYNFESRYEFLPTQDQIFSVGGFYKVINNPIESRYDATQPTFRTYTYANEKQAKVYGIELEFKKTLGFLLFQKESNFMDFFYVASNMSLINSYVEVAPNSSSISGRPLQGQSPYLINAAFGYDNTNNGFSATISANKYGRRMVLVGPTKTPSGSYNPNGYNIFENPRVVLDFQVAKTFKNKYSIKGTFGDILHQDLVLYNDVNSDKKYTAAEDNIVFKTKIGWTFTLSASATF